MAKKAVRKSTNTKRRATKYVFLFGRKTDGKGTMKPLLGGKGANLAEARVRLVLELERDLEVMARHALVIQQRA